MSKLPVAAAFPTGAASSLPLAPRADTNPEPSEPPPPPPPSAPPLDGRHQNDRGAGSQREARFDGTRHPPAPAWQPEADRHFEVGQDAANLREVYECPVCMEEIAPNGAAMRCTGEAGGQCHYFHAGCLSQWVQTQQGRAAVPSCPICRGAVEIHAQRLENFLARGETGGCDAYGGAGESKSGGNGGRKDLEDLLVRIRSLPGSIVDGWNNLSQLEITSEQLVEGATAVAGAGLGFYAGSSGAGITTGSWGLDRLMWENSSTPTKIATVVGYVVGTGWRWWNEADARAKEEEDRERGRRRRTRRG